MIVILVGLIGATGETGRGQEATPSAGCASGPATPVAELRTVDEEIAVDLDRLFGCMAAGDWAGVAGFVTIADGLANPFVTLAELDATGMLTIETALVSMTMRGTGPAGATVDLAWRVGSLVRYDRWTLQKRLGSWRVTLVEPGVPQFDGLIVGITGTVGAGGVELPRSELINPGGVEVLLEVERDVAVGSVLLVFPQGACGQAVRSSLTGMLDVAGGQAMLSLDGPADGGYALALVSTDEPLSRASICAAPTTVLTITS